VLGNSTTKIHIGKGVSLFPFHFQWGPAQQKSLRRVKTISNRFDNSNSTFIRSSATSVCGCVPFCGQCGTCTGEARWPSEKTSTGILRLRSTQFIKEKLHKIGESIVCCVDGLQEASTLFSSISYNSAFITTFEGHTEKQRSYMKDWKMGYKT
jgi:hypothetical protein